MIDPFIIGQGDTLPYYPIEVRDKDGAANLSDVRQVWFSMKNLATSIVQVSAPARITDVEHGLAEYRWAAGDTDVVGEYAATFRFITESNQSYSLPRNTIAKVVIEDRFVTG